MQCTLDTFPEPLSPEAWTFVDELKKPEPILITWTRTEKRPDELDLSGGITLKTAFDDPKQTLQTAVDDLRNLLRQTGLLRENATPLALTVTQRQLPAESYSLNVTTKDISLDAEDLEGLRRAIYFLEDQLSANDGPFLSLGKLKRSPWLKNRISRCFFSPIKRPPFNRDELLDDIDYYPDEYLNRLAHEGINGLWLTVEFRQLAQTSFTPRDPQAPQRLDKLRKTIDQCLRYGIKTWIFTIEPRSMAPDDPLLKTCPEFAGALGWDGRHAFCTSSPRAQQYLRETTCDIFSQLPGLGGLINISHGERITNCLSSVSATDNRKPNCPRCAALQPWEIHCQTLTALAEGIKQARSDAKIISWLYQPQPAPTRAEWLYQIPNHIPDNVILQYNFESGVQKRQLGKVRSGGDYWLSAAEPSEIFHRVADQAAQGKAELSAKIQVGCSHEVATVPFVPVPGLLYRKYKAMKACGCTSVMQCWYFGNYPGTMNRAAGALAFETFTDSEEDFLLRLAKPQWGTDATQVAQAWKCFSDAYENYPLSNDMQYYGPVHAGLTWPLQVLQQNLPLAPTWKPDFPPPGDSIGECLENHTLQEACLLLARIAEGWNQGTKILDGLAGRYAQNRPRTLDIGLGKALGLQFNSARNILQFYLQRTILDTPAAPLARRMNALRNMTELIRQEQKLTADMIPLCQNDSRLGFHSEAEAHLYDPRRLNWRIQWLQQQLDGPAAQLMKALPDNPQATVNLSDFLSHAETISIAQAQWRKSDLLNWKLSLQNTPEDLILELNVKGHGGTVTATLLNPHASNFPQTITVTELGATDSMDATHCQCQKTENGWKATVTIPALIWQNDGIFRGCFLYLRINQDGKRITWPAEQEQPRSRLNIGAFQANHCGIILR